MAKSSKISLSKEQAEEMYYNINSYFLFLQCAENIDKTMFNRLRFWNGSMNNHLRRSRESVSTLLQDFQSHFKAKDIDLVQYDAPSELYEAMEYLSRLHPDKIKEILHNLKSE